LLVEKKKVFFFLVLVQSIKLLPTKTLVSATIPKKKVWCCNNYLLVSGFVAATKPFFFSPQGQSYATWSVRWQEQP